MTSHDCSKENLKLASFRYDLSDDVQALQMQKKIFSKSEMWGYEEEWSIIKISIENSKMILDFSIYEVVVIGCMLPLKSKKEMKMKAYWRIIGIFIILINMILLLNAEDIKLNKDLIHEQDKDILADMYKAKVISYGNAKYFGFELDQKSDDFLYRYFNLAVNYIDLEIPEYKNFLNRKRKYKGKKNKLRFNIASRLLMRGINLFNATELIEAGIILTNYVVRGNEQFWKYSYSEFSEKEILDRLTLESLLIVKGEVIDIKHLGNKQRFSTSYTIKIKETIGGENFENINLVTFAGKNSVIIDGRHLSFKIGYKGFFFLNRKYISASQGVSLIDGNYDKIHPIEKKRNTFFCLKVIENLNEEEKKRVKKIFKINDVKNLFNKKMWVN